MPPQDGPDDSERVIKDWDGYRDVVQKIAADASRSAREREVEACFSESMPAILSHLADRCESKTDMLDRINTRLDANADASNVSRPTLYNWLSSYNIEM